MSTRSFWKSAGKEGGAPTNNGEADTSGLNNSSSLLDVSSNSLRTSEDGAAIKTLSAVAIDSTFLWKQPSKRRIISAAQKRYFVLTANELAYKEKDTSDEQEYRGVWKIPSEVLSVEFPEPNAKDFGVMVVEGASKRLLKLSGPDNDTSMRFCKAIDTAIKQSTNKSQQPATAIETGDAIEKADVAPKMGDELAIADATANSTDSSVAVEEASQTSDVAEQQILTTEESGSPAAVNETHSEEAVAIPIDSSEPKIESKSAGWFWGICCAAE